MKQIIELAQEQLSKEQEYLTSLRDAKEYSLNDALRLQGEIPVQESKVKELIIALEGLYENYGYPNGQSNCPPVAAAMPEINKGVKPMQSVKKSASVNKNDILRAVNELSFSDYAAALRAINDLNNDL